MTTYILLGVAAIIIIAMFFKSNKNTSYNNVTIAEMEDLVKDENTVLIDVRTPREIAQGVIYEPVLIELGIGMQEKFQKLDKSKKYIVYCRSGRRSITASKAMTSLGFTDVNNLLGGYIAWKQS